MREWSLLLGALVNVDVLVLSPFPKFLSGVIAYIVYPVLSSVIWSDTFSFGRLDPVSDVVTVKIREKCIKIREKLISYGFLLI